jgi:RHS repeat-associated protein
VDYAWDGANQLVSVTDNRAGGVTTSAYTATGRPRSVVQPSGVDASFGYDVRDHVTSLAWQRGAEPAFGSWNYGVNLRGQRTAVTDVTGRHVAYGYDAVSRLVSETITDDPRGAVGNGAINYSLDATGNRLSRISSLAAVSSTTSSYDANDQLDGDAYDANGNTTSGNGHTYAYDFENRLVSKDGGAVTIVYDGDGNRAAKTVGGASTKYLVDELNPTGYVQVLEEVSGNAVQIAYSYGTSVVSQRRVADGGAVSFYGYDAHGHVAFLTDAIGNVTDTYDYDAFGNLVATTGTTSNTRLFAGEELDRDVGLVNMRARYYDPDRGRFLSADPLLGASGTEKGPTNRFSYADSDPVNRRDPLGFLATEYGAHVQKNATWAAPAVKVQLAPVAVRTEIGLLTKYRIIGVAGGALSILGTALYCTFGTESSHIPLEAEAEGDCKDELQSCATKHPDKKICGSLPVWYRYNSPQEALGSYKEQSGVKNLGLGKPRPPTGGPCPGQGLHYRVTGPGGDWGSIVCCPCCTDFPDGPQVTPEKCGILP